MYITKDNKLHTFNVYSEGRKIFKALFLVFEMERDKITEGKAKFDGLFVFKDVYNFVYSLLRDSKYDVSEPAYSEKTTPEGKEIQIRWEARRKISDYFRFTLVVDWLVLGLTAVEAEKAGARVKMNKGSVEVKITAFIDKDYEERWESNAIAKFFRGIYDRYVVRSRIERYEEKVAVEVDELIAQLKSFLAMEGRAI